MIRRWLEVPDIARRLGVHEKTVYTFVARDGLPAARVGRKFVVAEDDLERWIGARRRQASAAVVPAILPLDTFTLVGGDALLVDSLLVSLRAEAPEVDWRRGRAAGLAALAPLNARDDVAALVNLREPGSGDLVPAARQALAGREVRVVPFLERPVGIALADPARARDLADVVAKDLRIAVREEGAGARVVAERLLRAIDPAGRWRARAVVAASHHAVGWMVAAGYADAGFCAPAAARAFNLHMMHLGWEPIDCVLTATAAGSVAGRALMRTLGSRALDIAWARAGYRRAPRGSRGARSGPRASTAVVAGR